MYWKPTRGEKIILHSRKEGLRQFTATTNYYKYVSKEEQAIILLHSNTYCPKSVLSKSVDPGTNFPAARLISLNMQKTKKKITLETEQSQ